jgi:GH15 family glucan-1,4-alpha-glucosidase
MNWQPIENHGVIGDLRSVALIAVNGSLDFMCFPEFDSPTVFAELLDRQIGGAFHIEPVMRNPHHKQIYLPDSNILLTRFLSDEGVAEISDFMAIGTTPVRRLVRRVKAVRRNLGFRLRCAPRFDYARAKHLARTCGRDVLFRAESPPGLALWLRSSVPLAVQGLDAVAEFQLAEGSSACFVLEQSHSPEPPPPLDEREIAESFKSTLNYWRNWLSQSRYRGRYREIVDRSALVLKLLTSAQHGSLIAAATFGLPEEIGGERNWDYRFTWIRDSVFVLDALLRLGFTEEARAFFRWLEKRSHEPGPTGPIQTLYGVDGRRDLEEQHLAHLEGYRLSRPVRVGNAAIHQLQLDIYGELIDAMCLYDRHGAGITYDSWKRLAQIINWIAEHWRQPDDGIWEVRGGRKNFLFSRLMCWVALDRGLRLARRRSFPAPHARWRAERAAIHHEIHTRFWDGELQSFVQHEGSKAVDASCLFMPLTGFIPPNDTRWFFTLRRIEQRLVADSLVFRYKPDVAAPDGLRGEEGTFSMCSFWYVECIARAGNLQKARFLFEKALTYANHLGLYSEQLSHRGEHLGNFPQAFTHIALISAALYLDRHLPDPG